MRATGTLLDSSKKEIINGSNQESSLPNYIVEKLYK